MMNKSPALRAFNRFGRLLVPPASSVLYLPGIGDPYGSIIRDRSGWNNNGTIVGATWDKVNGLPLLTFLGAEYVTLGTSVSLDFTSQITVKAWVYIDPAGGMNGTYGYIYNGGSSGQAAHGAGGLFFDDRGVANPTNGLQFYSYFTDDTYFSCSGSNFITTAGYYHIVGTYNKDLGDGEEAKLWVNNVKVVTATNTKTLKAGTLNKRIGCSNNTITFNPETFFIGKIGMDTALPVAWTAAQVAADYNRERHLFGA